MHNNAKHLELFLKAIDAYETLKQERENCEDPDAFDIDKKINKRAQEFNDGITPFGFHPELLPIKPIWPDVMNLVMGCTKQLLKHLKKCWTKRRTKFWKNTINGYSLTQ